MTATRTYDGIKQIIFTKKTIGPTKTFHLILQSYDATRVEIFGCWAILMTESNQEHKKVNCVEGIAARWVEQIICHAPIPHPLSLPSPPHPPPSLSSSSSPLWERGIHYTHEQTVKMVLIFFNDVSSQLFQKQNCLNIKLKYLCSD